MGAYLSHPKCEKDSADDANEYLQVGSSSMQGWRTSQEDAHNAILDFDTNAALFAVFDGHGGAEVAAYCAAELPRFLKSLPPYVKGDFAAALKDAFLGFDASLLEPQVAAILRKLSDEANSKENSDDEVEDLVELHEESNLPLNKVLEKYKGSAAGVCPSMPGLEKLKDGADKPQSPYLRGRRAAALLAEAVNKAVMNTDTKPEGSSTSAAAARAAASSNEAGPSSSKAGVAIKMDTEEDSTVSSSSSSSASKSATNANNTKAEPAASTVEKANDVKEAATLNGSSASEKKNAPEPTPVVVDGAVKDSAKELVSPDSSLAIVKENEQNGNVTSSESSKAKAVVSTSEAVVSGSSDATGNVVRIQNGTVGSTSSSSAAAAAIAAGGTISSTSRTSAVVAGGGGGDDDEEDADYEVDNSDAEEENDVAGEEQSSDDEADSDVEADENEMSFGGEDDDDELDTSDLDEDDEDEKLGPRGYFAMDEVPGKDSGCTAVVALLKGRDLYVANAGDSRCVVCRKGHAVEMSLDHKPEDEEETLRILKAGGRVTSDGRVNGGLNLSRAIGDHGYKLNGDLPAEEQMITALPDIKKLIVQPGDEFMVLACDGIWNYMSSEEVVQFVRERINIEGVKLSDICEELFETCLAPNTAGDGTGCDNMTAVIVRFQDKLMQLETKIDPKEAEDLPAKRNDDTVASSVSLKRPFEDITPVEVELSTTPRKRFKTDDDGVWSESSTTTSCSSSSSSVSIKTAPSATTSITTTSGNCASSTANEASSDPTTTTITTTATTATTTNALATSEEKECTTTATATS